MRFQREKTTENSSPNSCSPLFSRKSEPMSHAARGLLIGLSCAFALAALSFFGAFNGLEQYAFNALFRARGERPAQHRIILVLIDDDTFVRVKLSPLPRRVYADAIDMLHKAGARTILLNWMIEFPSGTAGDAQLIRACHEAGNVLQVASFDVGTSTPNSYLPERFALDWRGARSRRARKVAMPQSELLVSAPAIGYLNIHLESSGEWRHIQHIMAHGRRVYPSMPLAAAAHYLGVKPNDIVVNRGEITFRGNDNITRHIPLNRSGETMINWAGSTHYPLFTLSYLQDGRIPAAVLQDSIVIMGFVNAGNFTPISTPFSNPNATQTSLHLQANAIEDILENRPLREVPDWTPLVLLFALTMLGGAIMGPRGVLIALLWTTIAVTALLGSAFVALSRYNTYVPVILPLLGTLLTGVACLAYRQIAQARELRIVRDQFGAYVGEEVLKQLGSKLPELGGETRYISVLFCDIRDFTTLSEELRDEPSKLVQLVNAHFEPLVKIIKDRRAYVGNYMGDLILAIFGAPVEENSPDINVAHAVLSAVDFVRVMRARNEQWKKDGLPIIEAGIGVHTGPAVVGNIGSAKQLNYTAIGDTINTGSRVENLTRKYDVPLLVTEEVVNSCAGQPAVAHLKWEFVDETTVKGRTTPVRLFQCSNLEEILEHD